MDVFVTGISSGIGRDLVKTLVSQGHQVRGVARRLDKLESLAREVASPSFSYDCCDISDEKAVTSLFESMASQNYVPDAVILNAGIDMEDEYPALDFAKSCQMMRTNFDGAFYWITAFMPAFLARGSGQFIAVSSIFAHWPRGAAVAYSASKSALSMVMRSLRMRYPDSGIAFKQLYLGPVDTPINPKHTESEGSRSPIVASPVATAGYIADMLLSGREDFYFPWYLGIIFRCLRWLPDRWFELLTGPFKR